MKLTFDTKLEDRLNALLPADLVLDFDQTLGENGRPVEGCSIGTRYRLIAIDKDSHDPIFDTQIDSPLGPIFFKQYGTLFLKNDLTLFCDGLNRIGLKDDTQLIDSNVTLLDYRHN